MSGAHREWQLDLAKIDLRDGTIEAVCEKRAADHRERRKIANGARLEYQEIDVSQNHITWRGFKPVLDLCLQCVDLRVVKLFKNELSDHAAPSLCRLVEECRGLEQLHLSYNHLTAVGAKEILIAAHHSRKRPLSGEVKDKAKPRSPLWLRLEHNRIREGAKLLEELRELKISFCEAKDATKCGPRQCKRSASIHLPYFSKQDLDAPADPRVSAPPSRSTRPPPPSLPGQAPAIAAAPPAKGKDTVKASPSVSPVEQDDRESDGSSSSSSGSLEVIDIEASPPPATSASSTATPAATAASTATTASTKGGAVARAVSDDAECVAVVTSTPGSAKAATSPPGSAKAATSSPGSAKAATSPPGSAKAAGATVFEAAGSLALEARAASFDGASSEAAEPMATTDPYALDVDTDIEEPEVMDIASPAGSFGFDIASPAGDPEADEPEDPEVFDIASPTREPVAIASPSREPVAKSAVASKSAVEATEPVSAVTAEVVKAAKPKAKPKEAEKPLVASEKSAVPPAAAPAVAKDAPKQSPERPAPPAAVAKAAAPAVAAAQELALRAARIAARDAKIAAGSKDPESSTKPKARPAAPSPSAAVAPTSSRSRSRSHDAGLKRAGGSRSNQRVEGAAGVAAEGGASAENHKANNAGHREDGHHRHHEKKSKKEKGEKKRRASSDAGSGGSPAKSRKRRRRRRENSEGKEAKDSGKAPADSSQSGKSPAGGVLAMRPAQLSKKTSTPAKDSLAEVKEAFGLAGEDAVVPKQSKDNKDVKEPKDNKEVKEPKEEHKKEEHKKEHRHKHKKESKEAKDSKEAKSQKTSKEPKESNDAAAAADASKKEAKLGEAKPAEAKPGEAKPAEAAAKPAPLKGLAGLGNIADITKQIAEEKAKLRLFVIKAKQEWEEKSKGARGETNEQEYYIAKDGEVFGPNQEFRAEGSIGRGVFSSVFQCRNTQEDKVYAVKYVRANHMMKKAAEKEVELYRRLAKQAPKEDHEAAQFMMFLSGPETFMHQGHLAMIFELQKCDLRTALQKYGQGRGLPLQTVAQYIRQIFLCLRLLRKLKVIHGDLKPDNILMSLSKTEVKVCDFGSAIEVSEQVKTAYMQPRYYRAPEIIIGNSYDTQIDLWSAGVTLYELGTGKILFTGRTNNAMLRAMLEVCGEFPARMVKSGTYSSKHFNAKGDLLHKAPDTMTGVPEVLRMRDFVKPSKPISGLVAKVLKEPPPNADNKTQERLLPRLVDLLTKCLRINQDERFTPEHALAHDFFKKDR